MLAMAYPSVLLFEQDWLTPALSNALIKWILGIVHPKKWSLLLWDFLGCAIQFTQVYFLGGAFSTGVEACSGGLPILLGFCLALSPTVIWNTNNGAPVLVSHIRALIYT